LNSLIAASSRWRSALLPETSTASKVISGAGPCFLGGSAGLVAAGGVVEAALELELELEVELEVELVLEVEVEPPAVESLEPPERSSPMPPESAGVSAGLLSVAAGVGAGSSAFFGAFFAGLFLEGFFFVPSSPERSRPSKLICAGAATGQARARASKEARVALRMGCL
jgi:hypothetical protein